MLVVSSHTPDEWMLVSVIVLIAPPATNPVLGVPPMASIVPEESPLNRTSPLGPEPPTPRPPMPEPMRK